MEAFILKGGARQAMRMNGHMLVFVLCWTVTALPGRVIDGDTFDATASIWMGLAAVERVRILGVDSPEMKATTMQAALAAKQFTEQWLALGPVQLTACKRDSFGRILATVTRGQDNLAQALIQSGNGVQR